MADSALFTISDVKVDVTAENSAIAREQAFAKAQGDAFSKLAERMMSEGEIDNFTMPEAQTISTMIKDFEVTQEQLSGVRYVGTYTFRFNDKNVRQFFSGQGVRYTDVGSRPVLALPFYERDNGTVLWSHQNEWMRAWNRAGNLNGLVPIVVPIGDLMDVSDINDDQALNYDERKLQSLLRRYDAGEAAILFAVPDHSLLVASDQDPAVGSLMVQIYRTDRAGPEAVQNITVDAKGGETKQELFVRATKKVHKALQKNWKEKTIINPSSGNRLRVRVHYDGLEQWAATQTALERVYGVNEVVLQSLSPKVAEIELVFQGSEKRLRLALAQADMTLSSPQINPASFGYGGEGLVYELYLNRFRGGL
ncbi:MAG: hypothetical protein DHS20C02_17890 [Micavibrio sp.]|nr:MAG: hypothetical protein DHS20C02_17890 [Micavibrio sp.]